MKHDLLSIQVDILAHDPIHALRRAWLLCQQIEERHWGQAARPEGVYEPHAIPSGKETP